jgi:uncharacterized protein (DUF2249 family)
MNPTQPAPKPPLSQLNALFIRALKALGEAGQTDLASRLAGEGWKEIRHESPEEAEKLNGALHWLNSKKGAAAGDGAPQHAKDLEVRHLAPSQRHIVILETCNQLPVGDAIVLINDHDPKPLYYQFEAEFPGQFGWTYLQSGPEVWRVQIARKQAA